MTSPYGGRHKTRANYRKQQNTKYEDTVPEQMGEKFMVYWNNTEHPIRFGYLKHPRHVWVGRWEVKPDGILTTDALTGIERSYYIHIDGYEFHRKSKRLVSKDGWRDIGLFNQTGKQSIHIGASYITKEDLFPAMLPLFNAAISDLVANPTKPAHYIVEAYA